MQTILETAQFIKAAERVFSQEERFALINYLSANPTAGEEIVGSGGVRKVRYRIGNRGKSGSARVIYFFYNETVPLYLITCYAKTDKADLSSAEIAGFAKLTSALKAQQRRKTM